MENSYILSNALILTIIEYQSRATGRQVDYVNYNGVSFLVILSLYF